MLSSNETLFIKTGSGLDLPRGHSLSTPGKEEEVQ